MPRTVDPIDETATGVLASNAVAAHRRLLVVLPGAVSSFELPVAGTVVLGRARDVDIPIDHASVSRRHAALHIVAGALFVEDLGSANGTRVGGQAVTPGTREVVRNGATIEIGLATAIVQGGVPSDDAPPASPPSAEDVGVEPGAEGVDSTMARIDRLVALVAAANISVILSGETGVGKEVMAERLHRLSRRAQGPLVRLHCAALPEALLEGELFGYERGAFTGASRPKPGLVEAGDGGTLFLDEIGELPLTMQTKLLRVIESRQVLRLGSVTPRHIDVRFVSATHRDLEAMVASGGFRQDLFYRLNGMSILIPSLRDRRAEIPSLARELLGTLAAEVGRPSPVITARAMSAIERGAWPGNIRELRNVLERALVLCGAGPIDLAHLPGSLGSPTFAREDSPTANAPLRADVEAVERARIVEALEQTKGNQTEAARLLGVSRRTLVGRLDAYGFPRPRKK